MDDEETQPKCLCNAQEPWLCSGRDFFLEIQNLGPSSPRAEQEGKAEEETTLNENHVHSACKGDMAEAGMFYTLWKRPLGNFPVDGL